MQVLGAANQQPERGFQSARAEQSRSQLLPQQLSFVDEDDLAGRTNAAEDEHALLAEEENKHQHAHQHSTIDRFADFELHSSVSSQSVALSVNKLRNKTKIQPFNATINTYTKYVAANRHSKMEKKRPRSTRSLSDDESMHTVSKISRRRQIMFKGPGKHIEIRETVQNLNLQRVEEATVEAE